MLRSGKVSISQSIFLNKRAPRNSAALCMTWLSFRSARIFHIVLWISVDRFVLFIQEIVTRWDGWLCFMSIIICREISIAIRVDDSSGAALREFVKQQTFPNRVHLSYLKDNSNHYPINRLRNLAINNTFTSHFFMTDIDVWPACTFFCILTTQRIFIRLFSNSRHPFFRNRNKRS